MFAKVNSMGLFGMDAFSVEVEADLSQGLPKFEIVGLPDTAVSEAKDRVRSAIKNSGFSFPQSRVTINLSPADIRKEGSVYDLPIFIAIIKATEQLRVNIDDCAFIGELSLDGLVRRVNGALPMVIRAKNSGIKHVFVPAENALESSVVTGTQVFAVESVEQLIKHLSGEEVLPQIKDTLSKIDNWNNSDLFTALVELSAKLEIKKQALLWIMRIAITGKEATAGGATEVADILGKQETLNRIDFSINLLA